ncbi:hypothetical protein PC129_g24026 [Phytophthora cactorum]|uniref:Uncharacterized protein n=2 Tax=Phytophthora cactorum TaxID=29920 RepID=A0A8T1JFQ9_9STRA|nr:hypothetical protein PC111_g24132 [Phytophthora cactorum]KAG2871071.1 hypothetical protein PC114_g27094 [Phytophthora cactorum]KAG2874075.1 hypothetical protein PC115_g24223 [Phytophthora cactorum]KAG2958887.1 hypothetical protein PC119_g26880 [Phytophthora cactorum]KAG3046455.1 hypothetical protein PC122_g24341 [Phytophthora cactorum]
MVPRDSIPDYWIWGYYLAFHSYSFESFVFKQFENETSDAAKGILTKYGMEDVDVMQDMLYLVAADVKQVTNCMHEKVRSTSMRTAPCKAAERRSTSLR